MIERVALTQHTLGANPYVLIEVVDHSDGSGDPALSVKFGGGVGDDDFRQIPLLLATESDAPTSIVARLIRELFESGQHDRATLEAVTCQFNPEWVEWVFRPLAAG